MSQFKALIIKNWILFKRSWFGSLLEIIIPVAFMVLVFMIRKLATTSSFNQTQYVDASFDMGFYNATYSVELYGSPNINYNSWLLKNCTHNMVGGDLQRNGIIALVPTNDPVIQALNVTLSNLGYTTQYYQSDDALNAYIRDRSYGTDSSHQFICFGISMNSSTGNYEYKLRFNITNQGDSQGPDTTAKSTSDLVFDLQTITQPLYSGMLQTNTVIVNHILQKQLNSSYNINPVISPMMQQAYYYDPIYTFLGNSIDFLCLLPLLIVYLRQISSMISQKEKKIRQTMKIMGMGNFPYYFSWFLRYFIIYGIIHAISSVILWIAFPNINPGLVFIIFILFDIVLILEGFFIQIFFTRAKLGMVIGLLFFLVQYIVHFIVANSNITLKLNTYAAISPHSAFISSLQQILYTNSVNQILSFSNLTDQINNYAIYISYISFVIHIIFWSLITSYLQQVFPNEWGARKSPLFFLSFLWQKSSPQNQQQNNSINDQIGSNVEGIDQNFRDMERNNQSIRFSNVCKDFDNGRKAVHNLNLKMYKDQIFVLLGHNGAGKTTTISMLTGLLQPSSGKIQTLGYDTATQMDDLRQIMGICPQHDTLYDQLTVEEHLLLFGTFKGYSGDQLDQEVNKLIQDVNLVQKRDYFAKDLSGGQKRRLSVAIAFIGGSKLIFLDQPTSGMDTSARRYIWEMMKNYKNDRIIILTTHFMDEADFLGDRIGIMGSGKLICAGSSMFLKNKYGVGYNITIVKKLTTVATQPIKNLIQKIIPTAKIASDVSAELNIQLSMETIDKFPDLFKKLDQNKIKLDIESYGVSITTLEEVFLKVVEMNHNDDEDSSDSDLSPKKQIKKLYDTDRYHPSAVMPQSEGGQIIQIESETSFFRHLFAILIKRVRIVKRDLNTLAFEFIFPVVIIILALLIMRISFISDMPDQKINLEIFRSEGLPLSIPLAGNDSSGLLGSITTQMNNDYKGNLVVTNSGQILNCTTFDSDIVFPLKTKALKAGIFLLAVTDYNLTYYNLINTRSPVTPFLFPNLVAQSYINFLKGSSINITLINAPLPKTYYQLQINNAISGFLGAFIFSIALSFKFASIISFIVKQREERCKHQQIVSGMNIYAYWIGNFLYDYLLYALIAAFGAGMCMVFKISSLVDGEVLKSTWLLFMIYGMANIPFTYIASFLFKDYGNAQAGWYFFNFVAGGIASTVILLLRLISTNTNSIGKGLAWFLRLIPAFCFGEALLNSGSIQLLQFAENKGAIISIFDYQITLSQLIYLGSQLFGYFIILFIIEKLSNSQEFLRFFTNQKSIDSPQIQYDQDVLLQMNKAHQAKPEDYTIVTKNLRKVFLLSGSRHKVAVDKLSFTVSKGQVFGLLGINGAGKTTTFKMLSGELTSTSGDSYFNGMKISQNLSEIRKSLGYCPQFDALLQNLTVRQQLQLYYDMKGLPSIHKNKLIDIKIKELNLGKYVDILCGTLSGGNKRKLSVACAVIGDPRIVFLDQPSTGMDPQARRFMWRVISQIANVKKSTVILTTHSMEQAEALSTRLGIMVDGNFKCLGTPQHIKTKFGDGYQIELKLLAPTKEEILKKINEINLNEFSTATKQTLDQILIKLCKNQSIRKQVSQTGSGKYLLKQLKDKKQIKLMTLAEFILVEERGKIVQLFIGDKLGKKQIIQHLQTFYRFRLKEKMAIGKIFEKFQQYKQKLKIQQYSIKQATVQQIFNKFASSQEEQDQI